MGEFFGRFEPFGCLSLNCCEEKVRPEVAFGPAIMNASWLAISRYPPPLYRRSSTRSVTLPSFSVLIASINSCSAVAMWVLGMGIMIRRLGLGKEVFIELYSLQVGAIQSFC